jgi:hypothetical protein
MLELERMWSQIVTTSASPYHDSSQNVMSGYPGNLLKSQFVISISPKRATTLL